VGRDPVRDDWFPHQGAPLNFSVAELLEREEELARLGAALKDVRAGRGRLLVIEAPAGRGKSALLAALRDFAADEGMRVVDGRGGELERAFAFGTIRQLFERTVADAGPQERERLLAGAAAPAASIVAPDASARAESGFGALHAIYWLATNLSLEQPLLIAVDDLHWVDEPSLRALSYLARRVGDLAIALVVALRPAEPGAPQELLDELRGQPDALALRLPALSATAVASLVARAIPDADDELCAACFEATAGNPFYLVGLDGDASAAGARRAAVPDLGDRIVRRIDRIGRPAVALAQAMAVIGDEGSLADAAAVGGVDAGDAAAIAGQLRRAEILGREDPFAFAHPLVRHSVYAALTVAERDAAHAQAARVLGQSGAPPGMVAMHLSALRPSGSEEVASGLRAAAHDAAARGAPDAAAAALRRAVEEGAAEPPRAELLSELGEIEVLARDVSALDHLTEAVRLASDPAVHARAAERLAWILAGLGRWEELVALLTDAMNGLGEREPELRLDLEAMRAVILANHSDHVDAYEREVPHLLELGRGDSWAARALCAVVASLWASRGERLDEVLPLLELGLRDGRLVRERGAGGWATPQALATLVIIDENERALDVVEEVRVIARRDGSAYGTIFATGCRGWIRARRGDLAGAEGDFQTVVDIAIPNDLSSTWRPCTGSWPAPSASAPGSTPCRPPSRPSSRRASSRARCPRRCCARRARASASPAAIARARSPTCARRRASTGRCASRRCAARGARRWPSRCRRMRATRRASSSARRSRSPSAPGCRARSASRCAPRRRCTAATTRSIACAARSRCWRAPTLGSSTRAPWSRWGRPCGAEGTAPRRASHWPRAWSSRTAAARRRRRRAPSRSSRRPAPGPAAASSPASTRSR
jgi:AAA ATPase domain